MTMKSIKKRDGRTVAFDLSFPEKNVFQAEQVANAAFGP